MRSTPTVAYSDGLTIGQVADMWNRDPTFVPLMIGQRKVAQDERKWISNSAASPKKSSLTRPDWRGPYAGTVERGERNLGVDDSNRLANTLGCTLRDFF